MPAPQPPPTRGCDVTAAVPATAAASATATTSATTSATVSATATATGSKSYILSNRYARATFDEHGRLVGLLDRVWKRELVPQGGLGNRFRWVLAQAHTPRRMHGLSLNVLAQFGGGAAGQGVEAGAGVTRRAGQQVQVGGDKFRWVVTNSGGL